MDRKWIPSPSVMRYCIFNIFLFECFHFCCHLFWFVHFPRQPSKSMFQLLLVMYGTISRELLPIPLLSPITPSLWGSPLRQLLLAVPYALLSSTWHLQSTFARSERSFLFPCSPLHTNALKSHFKKVNVMRMLQRKRHPFAMTISRFMYERTRTGTFRYSKSIITPFHWSTSNSQWG